MNSFPPTDNRTKAIMLAELQNLTLPGWVVVEVSPGQFQPAHNDWGVPLAGTIVWQAKGDDGHWEGEDAS